MSGRHRFVLACFLSLSLSAKTRPSCSFQSLCRSFSVKSVECFQTSFRNDSLVPIRSSLNQSVAIIFFKFQSVAISAKNLFQIDCVYVWTPCFQLWLLLPLSLSLLLLLSFSHFIAFFSYHLDFGFVGALVCVCVCVCVWSRNRNPAIFWPNLDSFFIRLWNAISSRFQRRRQWRTWGLANLISHQLNSGSLRINLIVFIRLIENTHTHTERTHLAYPKEIVCLLSLICSFFDFFVFVWPAGQSLRKSGAFSTFPQTFEISTFYLNKQTLTTICANKLTHAHIHTYIHKTWITHDQCERFVCTCLLIWYVGAATRVYNSLQAYLCVHVFVQSTWWFAFRLDEFTQCGKKLLSTFVQHSFFVCLRFTRRRRSSSSSSSFCLASIGTLELSRAVDQGKSFVFYAAGALKCTHTHTVCMFVKY